MIQKNGGPQTTPKDLGISYDQSSKWQQLANVPTEEFEQAEIALGGPVAPFDRLASVVQQHVQENGAECGSYRKPNPMRRDSGGLCCRG
jgi:hypothetical protein